MGWAGQGTIQACVAAFVGCICLLRVEFGMACNSILVIGCLELCVHELLQLNEPLVMHGIGHYFERTF